MPAFAVHFQNIKWADDTPRYTVTLHVSTKIQVHVIQYNIN